ncbi:MAG: petC 1 [Schlesneria sp.]|nr:petC 1 [Schlesneria sp.]
MANPSSESPPVVPHGSVAPRRGFISLLAVLAGGIAGLVPVAAGTLFFMDPILRKRKEAEVDLLRAGDISDLPADGTPVRVVLKSDIVDAWTVYRDRVIGSIYLRLMPNGQVLAFNDTCTHLGCKVDYQPAQKQFFCPCHQSAFELDGERKNLTPPRNMDSLEAEVKDGEVWVKYQNFQTATKDKKAI